MNAYDVKLVALQDIKCAHAYLRDAHAVLRVMHGRLKKMGVSISAIEKTLALVAEARGRVGGAHLSLSEVVLDEQKESLGVMHAQGTV